MKCAVIVVIHNGKKWYDKCFGSLKESTYPLDIIVVDNNSSDDSVEYISNKFPEIILIKNSSNDGFAKGNNLGIKFAYDRGYDFLFLLNQDAWIEPNTAEKLIEISNNNSDYGIISPVHLTGDKNNFDRGFIHYFHTSDSLHAYENLYLGKNDPDCYDTCFVNAAAWLVTRKCIEVVGGFDTIMFRHYAEDGNYCNRVLFHKLKIGITTSVTICHDRENRIDEPFDVKLIFAERYANILLGKKWYFKHIVKTFSKPSLRNMRNGIKEIVFVVKNFRKIKDSRKINMVSGAGRKYFSTL
ncbi:MAG: glycosyltransferase family 2 protein [Termitinemataceae bacterium]|nr:MAG: glycosyltransferase family 2 protein [Termitinemataceae bacterium]